MGLGRGVPMQILSHQDVTILPGGYRDVPGCARMCPLLEKVAWFPVFQAEESGVMGEGRDQNCWCLRGRMEEKELG